MRATCLVCPVKRSPAESNSEALARLVLDALREEGVEPDVIRLADHQIDFGVVSEAVSDGDEWPGICDRIPAPCCRRGEGRCWADHLAPWSLPLVQAPGRPRGQRCARTASG
jgi:hypothetical protein